MIISVPYFRILFPNRFTINRLSRNGITEHVLCLNITGFATYSKRWISAGEMPVARRHFKECKHLKKQHLCKCFVCVCVRGYMHECWCVEPEQPCCLVFPAMAESLLGSHTSCCHISGHTLTHSVYTLHCPNTSSGFSPLSGVTKLTSLNMKRIKRRRIPGFNYFSRNTVCNVVNWRQIISKSVFSLMQMDISMTSTLVRVL